MNRALLVGTVDSQLSFHEQVHDETIVNRLELAQGIAAAVEQLISDEVSQGRRTLDVSDATERARRLDP